MIQAARGFLLSKRKKGCMKEHLNRGLYQEDFPYFPGVIVSKSETSKSFVQKWGLRCRDRHSVLLHHSVAVLSSFSFPVNFLFPTTSYSILSSPCVFSIFFSLHLLCTEVKFNNNNIQAIFLNIYTQNEVHQINNMIQISLCI